MALGLREAVAFERKVRTEPGALTEREYWWFVEVMLTALAAGRR